MKTSTLSFIFIMAVGIAAARPYAATSQSPCESIKKVVEDQGAVVLGTGGDSFVRLVRDSSYCGVRQNTEIAYVTALDEPSCLAGMRCQAIESN